MEYWEEAVVLPLPEHKAETLDRAARKVHEFQICPYCVSLDHNAIQDRGWPRPSLADVQKAAVEGCQCCHLLYRVVRDFELVQHLEKALRRIPSTSSPVLVIGAALAPLSLRLEAERPNSQSSAHSFVASKSVGIFRNSDEHDAPAWSVLRPPKYKIPSNLGDSSCIEFISTCLHQCLQNHEGESGSLPILPRRVIEINAPDSVRLLETTNRRAHYVTLSHRWGKTSSSIPRRTNSGSLQDHLADIPLNVLSPVFQDAIELTHMLGIRYLWIDSLCIVQDDKDDWVNESGKMSTTFGHSTLTIFAGSPAGCFVSRAGFQEQKYSYTTSSNQTIDLTAQSQTRHSHIDSPFRQVAADDLFKRGWVFQEWLLCSRAVVFTADELLWSCDHAVCCECKSTPQVPRAMRESWDRYQYDNLLQTRIVFRLETEQYRAGGNWLRLAQAYTTTKLTMQTDRLPALSGLAKRFYYYALDGQSSSYDNYLAGCWRHELVASLLWHSVPPRLPGDSKFIDMTRNSYIAPSWSWLSLPYYLKFSFKETEIREAEVVSSELISIEDVRCVRATSDQTGALRGGSLTVSGPVFDAVLMPTARGKQRPKLKADSWEIDAHGDHGSVPFSQLLATKRKSFDVACLVVRASFVERRGRYCEEGLVLAQSSAEASAYERIGWFDMSRPVRSARNAGNQGISTRILQGAKTVERDEFNYLLGMLRLQEPDSPSTARALLLDAPQKCVTIV